MVCHIVGNVVLHEGIDSLHHPLLFLLLVKSLQRISGFLRWFGSRAVLISGIVGGICRTEDLSNALQQRLVIGETVLLDLLVGIELPDYRQDLIYLLLGILRALQMDIG